MTSFKSHNYPKSNNGLLVMQEYAMQYYAAFNLILMLTIITKIYSGGYEQTVLWIAIIGEVVALILGNLLAYGKLNRTMATVFFVDRHFSMVSVYDMLFKKEQSHAFPLVYANPQMDAEEKILSVHFNDQIITLKREDWEEFDLLRDYFYAAQY